MSTVTADGLRFTAQYPLDDVGGVAAWARPERVTDYVRTAEAVGFDAVAFTDHPAPSVNWLETGGHAAFDPFMAVAFGAAQTKTIRFLTYLAIAPYRNPFLTAKSSATADRLSDGRFILGVGAGYLKAEFEALGVDHAERAELLEETVRLLPAIWSGEPVTHDGRRFSAEAQLSSPPPVQAELPVWVGGNSRRSRRLAAQHGHGWSPLLVAEAAASRAGTDALAGLDQFRAGVEELRTLAVASGRDADRINVHVKAPPSRIRDDDFSVDEHLEFLHALAEAGATWFVVHPVTGHPSLATEMVQRYGETVIATLRPHPSN